MWKFPPRDMMRRAAVALTIALAATLGATSSGLATRVPGGGPAKTDCLSEFDVTGVAAPAKKTTVTCTDGDPACDFDQLCNDSCTFKVADCLNQTDVAGCTPPTALPSAKETGKPAKRIGLVPPASSTCGAFVDAVVPVKVMGSRKKPGIRKVSLLAKSTVRPKKADMDILILTCAPREGACPPSTCTTPGVQGSCPQGKICGCAGACEDPAPCACGTTDPTQWKFTTVAGVGSCGTAKDESGTTLPNLDLDCGGLYFGGGSVNVPLPATIPDMGVTIAKVSACSGSCMLLSNATQAETGSVRTCSSTDCLFGAPLPVPNSQVSQLSTCIVNVVSQNAAGSATCDGGTATLSLPLASQLYLTGDLLPTVDGIQPCPICTGTPGTETCQGGPNDGLRCEPGTSVLGQAYPTSHDCLPPPGSSIGTLAIPFVLSTSSSSLGSHAEANQPHVFCGFCRDDDDGTSLFIDPAVSCTTSASCNGVHGIIDGMDITFESCAQLNSGCFGSPDCATITENGVAAGPLTDHLSHNITLATVFCIPPSFSGLVDPSAGLPGPGATALQGTVQLLP